MPLSSISLALSWLPWSSLSIVFVVVLSLLLLVAMANARTNKEAKIKSNKKTEKQKTDKHKTNTTQVCKEEKMSYCDLCCLFCCPPCPSSIAEKVAFRPPKPTYSIVKSDKDKKAKLVLSSQANWYYSNKQMSSIQVFHTSTSRGNRIGCMFIRGHQNPKYTILFSHGNAADLGLMATCYYQLCRWVNVNVFSYDYSGYGASNGKPSEANSYADIEAAFRALNKKLNVPPNRIILYGQSIGSAPTIDLAMRQEVAGVVLQSGFASGMRLMFEDVHTEHCCDVFVNIDKAEMVNSPVLIIHGTADEIINIEHGIELYKACPNTVEACWIKNAGHNDIMCYPEYYTRMTKFLAELDLHEMKHLDFE